MALPAKQLISAHDLLEQIRPRQRKREKAGIGATEEHGGSLSHAAFHGDMVRAEPSDAKVPHSLPRQAKGCRPHCPRQEQSENFTGCILKDP